MSKFLYKKCHLYFEANSAVLCNDLCFGMINLGLDLSFIENSLNKINVKTFIKNNKHSFFIKSLESEKNKRFISVDQFIQSKKIFLLDSVVQANIIHFFLNIKNNLITYKIRRKELEMWFCFSVILFSLLRELDPIMITVKIIPISLSMDYAYKDSLFILSKGLTFRNTGFSDIISIAFFKSIFVGFRNREKGVLLKFAKTFNLKTLLLEPPLLNAHFFKVSLNKHEKSLFRLEAILGICSKSYLVKKLISKGASDIQIQSILNENMYSEKILFISNYKNLEYLKEVLFKFGYAKRILLFNIEVEELMSRVVAISLSKIQKQKICRVTEYLFGNNILKVEIFKQDLKNISQSKKYSQNIIREDILSVWRKWK